MRLYRKFFGISSKVGSLVSAGGWNRKEAMKHAADNKYDYDRNKLSSYAFGAISPVTSAYALNKAEEMAEDGASPREIRKMLRNTQKVALGEAVLGASSMGSTLLIGRSIAGYKGLHTKLGSPKRRKFKEDKKYYDNDND